MLGSLNVEYYCKDQKMNYINNNRKLYLCCERTNMQFEQSTYLFNLKKSNEFNSNHQKK